MGSPEYTRHCHEEHTRARMARGIRTGSEEMSDDQLALEIAMYAVSRQPGSSVYLCFIEAARRLRKSPWLEETPGNG